MMQRTDLEQERQESTTLMVTMTTILKAQTEVIAVETQGAAAQSLPPLELFTREDEDLQVEEKSFERLKKIKFF